MSHPIYDSLASQHNPDGVLADIAARVTSDPPDLDVHDDDADDDG